MKHSATLLLLTLACVSPVHAQPDDALARKHNWLPDLTQARASAKKTGKPLLVVFRCVP
jgi:hypothetical protein